MVLAPQHLTANLVKIKQKDEQISKKNHMARHSQKNNSYNRNLRLNEWLFYSKHFKLGNLPPGDSQNWWILPFVCPGTKIVHAEMSQCSLHSPNNRCQGGPKLNQFTIHDHLRNILDPTLHIRCMIHLVVTY